MKPESRKLDGEPSRRDFLKQSGAAAVGCTLCGLPRLVGAAQPVWENVPDQNWFIGVPVYLDLNAYCSDPDGNPLSFVLDKPLPEGLTLENGVISGTPISVVDEVNVVATATELPVPKSPTGLSAQ